MDGDVGQDSAIDAEQLAFADRKAKQRAARRRELWRWLMAKREGRELLFEVILAELGYLHAIVGSVEQVYAQAALHNLCCKWMATDVMPHRELYLQMQNEAQQRGEAERLEADAMRATWTTRENGESNSGT
ncbi:MAG TPA: hypothetical protein VGR82_17550 [Methylomirabilota bacterium]|nr:hypothetical protein [Methylomirabilota bacterium]